MSNTLNCLQNKYGPLMSLAAVAKTFDRSKAGLRVSLSSKNQFSTAVNSAKIKWGRRVYFKTEMIALIIDEQTKLASEELL